MWGFDHGGVHFVAPTNVSNLNPGGMTHLGSDQIAWLKMDLAGLASSLPIVAAFAQVHRARRRAGQ